MNRIEITDTYPVADELRAPFLEAVRDKLLATPGVLSSLVGRGVFAGGDPADRPANGRFVIVKLESQLGGSSEHLQGWLTPRLFLRSKCLVSEFTELEALAWHTDLHAVAAAALLNFSASLAGGANGGTGTVVTREQQSDSVLTDAGDDTFYFSSFFSTRIIPAHAS